jgi:hypothetical protein
MPATWMRARQVAAATAMVVAPAFGLAWSFLVPVFRGSMDIEVAAIAANPDRFLAGTYLGVLMSFLMVPAALAWGRLLRPSAPMASDVASLLCATGACFHGAVLVFQLAELAMIAGVPDHSAAARIVSAMFGHRAFLLVLAPFAAFYLGMATLSVIVLVTRAAPLWIGALVLVGIVIEGATPIPGKARIFFAMLLIAFTGLAWSVWRLTPTEWGNRAAV